MRASVLLLTVIGLIGLAGPARAQHEKGDVSLAGSGTIQLIKGEGFSSGGANGNINVQLGVFVASNTEIGVETSLGLKVGGDGTDFSGLIGGAVAQYFGGGRTRFYVGLKGLTDIESVDLGDKPFYFLGRGGLRYYMNRNASFFVEANYGMFFVGGESYWQDLPNIAFGFAAVF